MHEIRENKKTGKPYNVEIWLPLDEAKHTLDALDNALNLRDLCGVTHTPIIRVDGSLLSTPGYDDASGYLYLPTVAVPPVPTDPTVLQVAEALSRLRTLLAGFPWVSAHDEANFLGLMLTPLLRLLCPPPYKLGAIMARQPGSGKSLLAQILTETHGGVFRSETPHDDAELAKSITSILNCTTAPIVQFDNVTGILRSARLAGLLTSAVYSDRVLGSTNNIEMVNDRLWVITGNNLNLGGDLVRRTLWVTIDPQQPDPHLRTGFAIKDLAGYVRLNRGPIIASLLTLVTAWAASGARPTEKTSSDCYAHWVSIVRGILGHAGAVGVFDHSDSAQQRTGMDDEGWGEFLAVIYGQLGDAKWTVRDLTGRMGQNVQGPGRYGELEQGAQELVDALPSDLHKEYLRARREPDAIAKPLGYWLRNRTGRWAGRHVALPAGPDRTKTMLWTVQTFTDSSGTA